jgi:CRISPR-associated protein Cmr2
MSIFIDYSIGPVQSFVAQSRRTRDLWGSSYLLSVLAGHAMLGAMRTGGEVVRPKVDRDPLFLRISKNSEDDVPVVGSLPNRFQVKVEDEDKAHSVASAATEAFYETWDRVQQAVWREFVRDVAPLGKGTSHIWDRQTGSFWEVQWTASLEPNSSALARRKLWRTHRLPDEPGDKCTVMHDFQELSGYCRATGANEAKAQDEFWRRVRTKMRIPHLREDERLCAIALVKRMFAMVARETLGFGIDTRHWPSTVYVAAVPWIREVLEQTPSSAERYASFVSDTVGSSAFTEQCTAFSGLDPGASGSFARLEPNYFHASYIENHRECTLPVESRRALLDRLRSLQQCELNDKARIGMAPSYYALLLADGDRVGALVRELGGDAVGRGLREFSEAVPDIVQDHDGVTIYGGGDDVLAMLPVPSALRCAQRISEQYRLAFAGFPQATLSASVVFAQIRMPLTDVIKETHRLLDRDAKELNGRDSLAVAVRNRGGPTCKWVTTWIRKLANQDRLSSSADLVESVSRRLSGERLQPGVSVSLIYRLRELITMLADNSSWAPGDRINIPVELDGFRFVRAEVIRTLADDSRDPSEYDELAELVWNILQASTNEAPFSDERRPAAVTIDGLLLARFLATGGREEGHR